MQGCALRKIVLLNLWNPGCPAYDFDKKAKIIQSAENKSQPPGATGLCQTTPLKYIFICMGIVRFSAQIKLFSNLCFKVISDCTQQNIWTSQLLFKNILLPYTPLNQSECVYYLFYKSMVPVQTTFKAPNVHVQMQKISD